MRHHAITLACVLAFGACSSDSTPTPGTSGAFEVVADGFDGPTQIADGPEGMLLVAQLAGGENDATGEVVVFDPATDERRVVLDGLDKPTGVIWLDGVLWVMVRRGLVRAEWPTADAAAGPVEVVLDDLAFNGRSQGTLTGVPNSLPDDRGGGFLYDTSGSMASGEVVAGSGTLWRFDPVAGTSTAGAAGAKHAYAHAITDDGRVVTTEIDDSADPAPDEVNLVPLAISPAAEPADPVEPVDLGWPSCRGDQRCDGVVTPTALFAPGATPTGVAVVGDQLWVALFVTGELVRVALDGTPADAPETMVSGLAGPHTILVRPDGTLWVSEHLTGRILSITP